MELTNEEIVLSGLGELGAARNGGGLKTAQTEVGASPFRKQMLERLNKLPKHVQKALKEGKAQISDASYYATSEITGTRAEVIKISNSEQLGITNIDNGKLGKDKYFVLSEIKLMFDAAAIDGAFETAYPPALKNGEWELELNGRKVFEKMPVYTFNDGVVGYDTNKPFGIYTLNNPKMIEPQTPVEFNVSLAAAQVGFLRVFLIGTTVHAY